MPHIDIKYFPRDLSVEEKEAAAAEICQVIKKYFGSSDNSISIAMKEIPADRWKAEVYDPIIKVEMEQLVKKPGYSY